MNKDIERIGDIQHYKGVFQVCKTDDLFKYCLVQDSSDVINTVRMRPIANIDAKGVYVGENRFIVLNDNPFKGDVFYEAPVTGNQVYIPVKSENYKYWVGSKGTS